jgi:hypothetical protein
MINNHHYPDEHYFDDFIKDSDDDDDSEEDIIDNNQDEDANLFFNIDGEGDDDDSDDEDIDINGALTGNVHSIRLFFLFAPILWAIIDPSVPPKRFDGSTIGI